MRMKYATRANWPGGNHEGQYSFPTLKYESSGHTYIYMGYYVNIYESFIIRYNIFEEAVPFN